MGYFTWLKWVSIWGIPAILWRYVMVIDIQWEHNGQTMRIWDNDILGIWGSLSGHGELIRGNHSCQFVIWYVPDIAEDDDLSWNIRKKHTHTYTHTHIYIYIYIVKCLPHCWSTRGMFSFLIMDPSSNSKSLSHYISWYHGMWSYSVIWWWESSWILSLDLVDLFNLSNNYR